MKWNALGWSLSSTYPRKHVETNGSLALPCMHMCVCEACTQQLQELGAQSCPVCRGPIEGIERVFT